MTARDPFAGLRIPVVRSFALGRAAAVISGQIVSVAVGWQLYERTGSAFSLGLVGAFEILPVLFFTFPAGNAADRRPRRNVAIAAHTAFAVVALGLAAVSAAGAPTAVVYALLVAGGTARTFSGPSVGTILPQLLAPEQYANVNAWIATTYEVASISGPALGGALIASTGSATAAYVVAAAGQVVFVALLSRLPRKDPPPAPAVRTRADFFAGFSFIRRNPVFLAAITLDLFAVLLGGAVALLPIFAKDVLHVGPQGLGWLRAAPAIGALSMALLSTHLAPFRRPGRVLLATVAGFGLATIGFGLSRHLALSLLCLFLTGVFDEISVVIRMTLEQVLTPDALRGRVSAFHYVFIGFSNELGAFESGVTAALFGPFVSVVGGGIGTLLVVVTVSRVWKELAAIGPLHALRPPEEDGRSGADG